ncbi:MAG: flagellar hook-associated protein FlgK [Phycisphaerales bacterium JB059]
MSLTAAIQIARSALTTSQIGLQVAGQNLANLGTPGYTRQVASLSPIRSNQSSEFYIGRGVQVDGVRRQINEAVQKRLWNGVSDEYAKARTYDINNQLESLLNELTGFDLSSELSGFFNAWSEAANLVATPASVVEQGDRMAGFINSLRQDLGALRRQLEDEVDASVLRADAILEEIASINTEIQRTEGAAGTANALRDQRDNLITELSQFLDVTVVENSSGNVDILVGSTPIVLGSKSRGLDVERREEDGVLTTRVVVGEDNEPLPVTSGSIGGLLEARNSGVDETIEKLDTIASELIFRVNALHSTGRNASQLTSTIGTLQVRTSDRTLAINDPDNETFADLPYSAENGGFYVEVTNSSTGATQRVRVDVDLDGLNSDDTTPEDIRAAIDGITGVNASWDSEGKLTITADADYEFSFADDSSGVLAVLGVNSYFEGTDADSISVRQDLIDDPSGVMLGRSVDGEFVENATALELSNLRDEALTALSGSDFSGFWRDHVQHVGTQTSASLNEANAASLVRESLEAQRASISGVDADEESVNLITFQQQYSGAARLIQIADQLMDELLAIV